MKKRDNDMVTSPNGEQYYSYGKLERKEKRERKHLSRRERKNLREVIGLFILIVLVIWGCSFLFSRDMTEYLSSSEDAFLRKAWRLKIQNNKMKDKIPLYSDSEKIEIYGCCGVYTIHIDGEYVGVHITDRRFKLFGIKPGKAYVWQSYKLSYQYDYEAWITSDSRDDSLERLYYSNSANNDCFIICKDRILDDVESITYYRDCKKATKTIKLH